MNSFDSLVNTLSGNFHRITVTKEQYEQWKRHYVVDVIKGVRLGQSFCEFHGIGNASPLYHFKSNNFCEQWIHDYYLEK